MSAEAEYGGSPAKDRKIKYRQKLIELLNEYKNIMIIKVDNVGSNQMQKARMSLRGKAIVLMGKNTIMRKVIRDEAEKNPRLTGLLPFIRGNIGFIFTNGDLSKIREQVQSEKVAASAKGGQFAPVSIVIPAGMTALDPGQTSFFQAMNIATKITKGAIEIINDVKLVEQGERVTSSAVGLLNKLGIKPFFYSIMVAAVYEDGDVYLAEFLDLDNASIAIKFGAVASKVAALSLAIGYPTAASIPHSFSNTFKTLVSLSLATAYTFEGSAKYRELLENPELLAAAQAAAGGGAAAPAAGGEAAAAVEEEEDEEEDEAAAAALFGGDGDEDY